MNKFIAGMIAVFGAAAFAIFCIIVFEAPPIDTVQRGFRGLGMVENTNPRLERIKVGANQLPEPTPPSDKAGHTAASVYKNVPILGSMDEADFLRLMSDITAWVAPQQGCVYCHDENDYAAERPYTKIVSRRMLEMVRYINGSWKTHVADTGVSCFACHRGQPVPANAWFLPKRSQPFNIVGNRPAQNLATGSENVAFMAVQNQPFAPFLQKTDEIRVVPTRVLHGKNVPSMQATEATYGLMGHISQALGVNCTYCHNSRSFMSWDQSTPQRSTAWYAIRMVRALNNDYLEPLKPVFPANRLGPQGDVAKVNCTTCHAGVAKPLYGAAMIKDYPILVGPAPARTASAAK
ncbi:Photosynthetic reaction center cytochrome c subunit [Rhodovulum sp. PH10]|uniref:photosynthetic reaction center cytochrome PufC n=1 Tax=Rhodovulum sp. PH10 TaxID=1187851 RepID=UPI00027C2197|nr:photosynthetic reaction center cytochrome PufC [Rhodovulum sp. PH10]EJW12806.1 Photosynthetic reaction center cytochrome c subunit [Rhodovulum sp. PH10]